MQLQLFSHEAQGSWGEEHCAPLRITRPPVLACSLCFQKLHFECASPSGMHRLPRGSLILPACKLPWVSPLLQTHLNPRVSPACTQSVDPAAFLSLQRVQLLGELMTAVAWVKRAGSKPSFSRTLNVGLIIWFASGSLGWLGDFWFLASPQREVTSWF